MTTLETEVADKIVGEIKDAASDVRSKTINDYYAFLTAVEKRTGIDAVPPAPLPLASHAAESTGLRVQFQDHVAAVEKELAKLEGEAKTGVSEAVAKLKTLVHNTL